MYHGKYVDFCVCGSYWFTNLSFFFYFLFFHRAYDSRGIWVSSPSFIILSIIRSSCMFLYRLYILQLRSYFCAILHGFYINF